MSRWVGVARGPNLLNFELNLISAKITSYVAWASSVWEGREAKFAWKGTDQATSVGIFHSQGEDNPWLRIKLNRKETITSVTIRNRIDCCGERLENLEIRAGTKNDLTNEIVGRFKGPGVTGQKHVVQFTKSVVADFLMFQLKGTNVVLQINGIYLNEQPALGKYLTLPICSGLWVRLCERVRVKECQSAYRL